MKVEKRPGRDWVIGYRNKEDGHTDEMLVFGVPSVTDAIEEAHYSLSAMSKDWYEILGVVELPMGDSEDEENS